MHPAVHTCTHFDTLYIQPYWVGGDINKCAKSTDACDTVDGKNDGWNGIKGVNRKNSKHIVLYTPVHVFMLCTLNHTGSEELLINVLELQIHVALWGMETVGATVL